MSDNRIVVRDRGIGFIGLLLLMFIAFKLLGIIHWSWFWVLSPVLIPVGVGVAVVGVIGIIAFIVLIKELVRECRKPRR